MGKGEGGGYPIKYYVVLMLENRSFDHMLGFLKRFNPNINGLTGTESNPLNPADPSTGSITVSDDAEYVTSVDPSHSVNGTTMQLWGVGGPKETTPTMNGSGVPLLLLFSFLITDIQDRAAIMRCDAMRSDAMRSKSFVYNYNLDGDPEQGADIMKCFEMQTAPVINSMASQFGVVDAWFASVPGSSFVA